jgi:hypothetical protein
MTVALTILFLASYSFAQDASSLQGTWEFTVSDMCESWGDVKQPGAFKIIGYLYAEPFSHPRTPNLLLRIPGELDMEGFSHGTRFVLYRVNDAHCGGETVNLGRELIIGTVIGNGRQLVGNGLGFDSNPQGGGTCSYNFAARKISGSVPGR